MNHAKPLDQDQVKQEYFGWIGPNTLIRPLCQRQVKDGPAGSTTGCAHCTDCVMINNSGQRRTLGTPCSQTCNRADCQWNWCCIRDNCDRKVCD